MLSSCNAEFPFFPGPRRGEAAPEHPSWCGGPADRARSSRTRGPQKTPDELQFRGVLRVICAVLISGAVAASTPGKALPVKAPDERVRSVGGQRRSRAAANSKADMQGPAPVWKSNLQRLITPSTRRRSMAELTHWFHTARARA